MIRKGEAGEKIGRKRRDATRRGKHDRRKKKRRKRIVEIVRGKSREEE